MVNLYEERKEAAPSERPIDIVFRGTIPARDIWLYHIRKMFEEPLAKLARDFRVIVSDKRVTQEEYYRELTSSKICVSPFGYGEIRWRDFEAIICGCLLIKPDVSHIKTNPDIFVSYKTYVPVKWDLSDIEEKCRYYLDNQFDRELIIAEAWKSLSDFYERGAFLDIISRMLGESAAKRGDRGLAREDLFKRSYDPQRR